MRHVVNWELVTFLAEYWFAMVWQAVLVVLGGLLTAWTAELMYNAVRHKSIPMYSSIGVNALGTRAFADVSYIIISTYLTLGFSFMDYLGLAGDAATAIYLLAVAMQLRRSRLDLRKPWYMIYLIVLLVWIGLWLYLSINFIITLITF